MTRSEPLRQIERGPVRASDGSVWRVRVTPSSPGSFLGAAVVAERWSSRWRRWTTCARARVIRLSSGLCAAWDHADLVPESARELVRDTIKNF